MPAWLLFVGYACVTYLVSRLTKRLVRGVRVRSRTRLVLAHVASFAVILVVITFERAFDPSQALPYLPAQAMWFGVDLLRSVQRNRNARIWNPFLAPQAGMVILVVVAVASVGYLGRAYMQFAFESTSYAQVPIGASPAEAVYALGAPGYARAGRAQPWSRATDRPDGGQWLYAAPRVLILFDERPAVASIACIFIDGRDGAGCYSSLGLGTGNQEVDVTMRLGAPTSATVSETGRKVMQYPEIGHEFVLEQFRVQGIRVSPDNGDRIAKLWRFLRFAVP